VTGREQYSLRGRCIPSLPFSYDSAGTLREKQRGTRANPFFSPSSEPDTRDRAGPRTAIALSATPARRESGGYAHRYLPRARVAARDSVQKRGDRRARHQASPSAAARCPTSARGRSVWLGANNADLLHAQPCLVAELAWAKATAGEPRPSRPIRNPVTRAARHWSSASRARRCARFRSETRSAAVRLRLERRVGSRTRPPPTPRRVCTVVDRVTARNAPRTSTVDRRGRETWQASDGRPPAPAKETRRCDAQRRDRRVAHGRSRARSECTRPRYQWRLSQAGTKSDKSRFMRPRRVARGLLVARGRGRRLCPRRCHRWSVVRRSTSAPTASTTTACAMNPPGGD